MRSLTVNKRNSVEFDVQRAAEYLSSQAEEYLSDHNSPAAMDRALAAQAAQGDCATVYSIARKIVDATACDEASDARSASLAASRKADSSPASESTRRMPLPPPPATAFNSSG